MERLRLLNILTYLKEREEQLIKQEKWEIVTEINNAIVFVEEMMSENCGENFGINQELRLYQ